ncbi:MAG: glycosyltransferase family 4 protein [Acidimicrobiales bacterium]
MKLALSLPGIPAETIETVEFYRSDCEILPRIGETTVVTDPFRLPRDADVVFSWWWDRSLVAAVMTRLRMRAPLVVTGASDVGNPVGLRPERAMVKNCAARLTASLAHANVAVSHVEASRVRRWRFPRVQVVPLAVDTEYFRPTGVQERDPFLLLTVLHLNHRSVERKGLLHVIDALERCDDRRFRLVVVGEDQGAASSVSRYAETHGVADRVRLTGRIPRPEKRALLWSAGLYVQISAYEGFGYAVAEAMAAGCPTVTSSRGSLPEVTGGSAYAYADTSVALAQAMTRAEADRDGLQRAADATLARVTEELSFERREQRLKSLFGMVLG